MFENWHFVDLLTGFTEDRSVSLYELDLPMMAACRFIAQEQ